MTRDELLDLTAALEHDLGKHLALPVTMLPASATGAELAEAVRLALHSTRRAKGKKESARRLWEAFVKQAEAHAARTAAWAPLCAAVERALTWEARLPADRAAVTADLTAVRPAIRALLAELQRG
jgi:hypothetical protein